MASSVTIISPASGAVVATHAQLSSVEALDRVAAAKAAFPAWRKTTLDDRIAIVSKFVDAVVADKENIAVELATLIGR
ncbi:hypothetical protein HK100_009928, partial [Physocladia obscura]